MDMDDESSRGVKLSIDDLKSFDIALAAAADTQVLTVDHLVDDEDKEMTLRHQVLWALVPGKMPSVETVFSGKATLMWRDSGKLIAESDVTHRFEGADFVLLGRFANFWPPPLTTPSDMLGRWSSDCWEVVFLEPPSKDFLIATAESSHWIGASWFRKGASPSHGLTYVWLTFHS